MMAGIIDASATRKLSTPRTRSRGRSDECYSVEVRVVTATVWPNLECLPSRDPRQLSNP